MRISDWSSDVCSSDLQGMDQERIGTRNGACRQPDRKLARPSALPWPHPPPGSALSSGRWRSAPASPARHSVDPYWRGVEIRSGGDRCSIGGRSRDVACAVMAFPIALQERSEEHTSELQSLMRISYAVFCLKKTKHTRI